MNLSSIHVYSSPRHLDEVNIALAGLLGVEVQYKCRETGRMVVIQDLLEKKTKQMGLRRIKTTPHVLAAELVYHYQDSLDELTENNLKESLL